MSSQTQLADSILKENISRHDGCKCMDLLTSSNDKKESVVLEYLL